MEISTHQIGRPKAEEMLKLALNENQVINHTHVKDLIMVHYPQSSILESQYERKDLSLLCCVTI